MNKSIFKKGIALLAAAAGRTLVDDLVDAYYLPLGNTLTEDEWRVKVREALATFEGFGSGRMPAPAFFNRERREKVERDMLVLVHRAFQCIFDGECTKEAGDPPHRYVSRPLIVSKFGDEIAAAFDAVGGGDVFLSADARGMPFLRNAFVAFATPAIRARALREITDGSSSGTSDAGAVEASRGGRDPQIEGPRGGPGSAMVTPRNLARSRGPSR